MNNGDAMDGMHKGGTFLRRYGHLIALAVALAAWALATPEQASWLFLPTWIVVTQLIFAGSLESARLSRQAWLGQYLRPSSSWYHLMRGGVLMIVWHQVFGAVLGLFVLVKLRLLPLGDWLLLLLALVVLVTVMRLLCRRLEHDLIEGYTAAVVRRLVVVPVAALLTAGLLLSALFRPLPYLVGLPWGEALARHLHGLDVATLLGFFERLASAIELTQYWAMQNALESLRLDGSLEVLGWAGLVFMQAAFAWAFVRLAVGVDALKSSAVIRSYGGSLNESAR